MGRERFYGDEEKIHNRLLVLKELVSEQGLHEKPCPLLVAQLDRLEVLCSCLQLEVRKLAKCVEKAANDN